MGDAVAVGRRFRLLQGVPDERLRRLVAAAEAKTLGVGGQALVARATGVSRRAIRVGLRELRARRPAVEPGRVRRLGGGRKQTVAKDPTLLRDLERLVEPSRAGTPSRRCAGPARACAAWRPSCAARGTRSAISWWASC